MAKLGRIVVKVFVLTIVVACAACTLGLGAVQSVDEGGFSFRYPAGYGAEIVAAQATIVSDDEAIKIRLIGKSACDVESLEGMTDRLLGELADGMLEFLEYGELDLDKSHPIVIGTAEGWAADVSTTSGGSPVSGRAVMVAPSNSHLFFALATAETDRWAKEGKEALDVILDSIAFFEPINPSSFIPCFIHHTPPELAVDIGAFRGADLADLGCHALRKPSDLFGGLLPSYPLIECDTYDREGGYLYFVGEREGSFGYYVIFRDGEFVPIRTEEAFREVYAPVETAEEALSYALALTYSDRSPRAHYGFELEGSYSYFVDTIEDTHVERVEDGYIVHLFDYQNNMCGGFGQKWVQTFAVDFHVTTQGEIEQVRSEPIYQILSPCLY